MTPGHYPDRVSIFPWLAAEALRRRAEIPFTAWSLLREYDSRLQSGRGAVGRSDALRLFEFWRSSVNPRSRRRFISRMQDCQFIDVRGETLWLASAGRLLNLFELTRAGTPHLVPVEILSSPAAIRAQLYATLHELPNHRGGFSRAPLSRADIEAVTGVSRRAQARWDNEYGVTELVQERYARILSDENVGRSGHGYFVAAGAQWRRLPDQRSPLDHARGSKGAGRRANRTAQRLRSESAGRAEGLACDQSLAGNEPSAPPAAFERTHFFGDSKDAAFRRFAHSCRYCRPGAMEECPHVSGVMGWGRPGEMRFAIKEKRQ